MRTTLLLFSLIFLILKAFGQILVSSQTLEFSGPPDWMPYHHETIVTTGGAYIEHPIIHSLLPLGNGLTLPKLELKIWENPHKSPHIQIIREKNIKNLSIEKNRIWLLTDHLFSFDHSGTLLSKSNRLGPRDSYFDNYRRVTIDEVLYGHAFGSPEEGLWLRPGRRYKEKELAAVKAGEEIVMWQIHRNQSKPGSRKMKFREVATILQARHDTTWRPVDFESFGAYTPQDKLLFITYNDAARIDVHDLNGNLIRSIEHASPVDPLTPSKRDTFDNGKPYGFNKPMTKARYSKIFLSEDGKTAFRIHHFGATEEEMELPFQDKYTAKMAFHSALIAIDLASGEMKQYPVPKGMYVVSVMNDKVYLRKADERPGDIGLHVYEMKP